MLLDIFFSPMHKSHTQKSFFQKGLKHTNLEVFIQSLVLLPGRNSGRHEEDSDSTLDAELRDVGDLDEDLSFGG